MFFNRLIFKIFSIPKIAQYWAEKQEIENSLPNGYKISPFITNIPKKKWKDGAKVWAHRSGASQFSDGRIFQTILKSSVRQFDVFCYQILRILKVYQRRWGISKTIQCLWDLIRKLSVTTLAILLFQRCTLPWNFWKRWSKRLLNMPNSALISTETESIFPQKSPKCVYFLWNSAEWMQKSYFFLF